MRILLLLRNFFGDDGWGAIDCNPETTHEGSKHTIVVPVLTSAAEIWRAQWKFHTDLSATVDDTVDFSVKINSTVKLPGMIVKLTKMVMMKISSSLTKK